MLVKCLKLKCLPKFLRNQLFTLYLLGLHPCQDRLSIIARIALFYADTILQLTRFKNDLKSKKCLEIGNFELKRIVGAWICEKL